MKNLSAVVASALLLALSACGNLPPGHVPLQPNAAQGGGAAYLNAKMGGASVDPSYLPANRR